MILMSKGRSLLLALSLLACGLIITTLPAQAQELSTGLHYFAAEDLDRERIEQRGTTGSLGTAFANLILSPSTRYRIWILKAETLDVAEAEVKTGPPGSRTRLPTFKLMPINPLDSDRDGLPDLAESIVGTDVHVPDTDGDGIPDGEEVHEGQNPLDGLAQGIGVRARVQLDGTARDLAIEDDLLVVAHGTRVSGFNSFTGMTPVTLFSLEIDGDVQRVAVSDRHVVAVSDTAGVAVYDVSVPSTPVLLTQIPAWKIGGGELTAVAVADELAWVATSTGQLSALDLNTGFIAATRSRSDAVLDLGIRGRAVYALGETSLTALRLDLDDLSVGRTLNAPNVDGSFSRLFLGDGYAASVHISGATTFDLSSELVPRSLGHTIDTFVCCFSGIAVDTGNRALLIRRNSDNSQADLHPYEFSDLTVLDEIVDENDDDVIDVIGTPGAARAVVIANGFAYVADGDAGLTVASYRNRVEDDTPPSIALAPLFDPKDVERGERVILRATVTDDVQVRSVEFAVGDQITTDATYPFELRFTTPTDEDAESLTIQARAFDTGGNSASTDLLTITLSDDTTSPRFTGMSPSGVEIAQIEEITAVFDERLDGDSIGVADFHLAEAGDDGVIFTSDDVEVTLESATLQADSRTIVLAMGSELPPGRYVLIAGPDIEDIAGNAMSSAAPRSVVLYDWDVNDDGIADGLDDADGDGVFLAIEAALGLSDEDSSDFPVDRDADEDGLTDFYEIYAGLNPNLIDSDGDGITDLEETEDGSDPLSPLSIPTSIALSLWSSINNGFDQTLLQQNGSLRNDGFDQTLFEQNGSLRNDGFVPEWDLEHVSVSNE